MLEVHFAGWFQCRLATGPADPVDEPRLPIDEPAQDEDNVVNTTVGGFDEANATDEVLANEFDETPAHEIETPLYNSGSDYATRNASTENNEEENDIETSAYIEYESPASATTESPASATTESPASAPTESPATDELQSGHYVIRCDEPGKKGNGKYLGYSSGLGKKVIVLEESLTKWEVAFEPSTQEFEIRNQEADGQFNKFIRAKNRGAQKLRLEDKGTRSKAVPTGEPNQFYIQTVSGRRAGQWLSVKRKERVRLAKESDRTRWSFSVDKA